MIQDIIYEQADLRYLEWSRMRHSSGTAGSFLKAREERGGARLYYKLSDFDSMRGVVGHECVNEIVAARLLSLLRIEHLSYTLIHALIQVEGRDVETWLCRSEDFRRFGEAKIALEDFYQAEREAEETQLSFCVRMGWERYIYEMLVLDYLILNRDRHGANIEVLRNRRERTLRPAPLFDHGLSFACRCQSDRELEKFDVNQDRRVQSFVGGGAGGAKRSSEPRYDSESK